MTALREYRRQQRRLVSLNEYDKVLTHSNQTRELLIKSGLDEQRIRRIRFGVKREWSEPALSPREVPAWDEDFQLLFVGRFETEKGGQVLLESLPSLQQALGRRLTLNFVGGGPAESNWRSRAESITRQSQGLTVQFTGWADRPALAQHFLRAHLLVIPSLWPEPFGMVGLEAAEFGVPTVAFDVGGICEWLKDGVNGVMASSEPPSAYSLTSALVRALEDKQRYKTLRRGAEDERRKWSMEKHVDELFLEFERLVA